MPRFSHILTILALSLFASLHGSALGNDAKSKGVGPGSTKSQSSKSPKPTQHGKQVDSLPKADKTGTPILKTEKDAKRLLTENPISLESWSKWRGWLHTWITHEVAVARPCIMAAREFTAAQVDENGELPEPLRTDALAWYLYGAARLAGSPTDNTSAKDRAIAAEPLLLRSRELDAKFAPTYRYLGFTYFLMSEGTNERVRQRGEEQLAIAKSLNPDIRLTWVYGLDAAARGDCKQAIEHMTKALEEEPQQVDYAVILAQMHLQLDTGNDAAASQAAAQTIGWLAKKYPQEGRLACFNGMALLATGDRTKAGVEFERAETLGVPLETVVPADVAETLRSLTATSPILLALTGVAVCFVLFYATVICSMIAAAFVLSRFTKGTHALKLMKKGSEAIVQDGRVVRTKRETVLSRLYLLLIMSGLVLFYLSIPFIVAGILGGTGLIVYGIFLLDRIPVKLVVLILVIGIGMAIGVLRSLFAKAGSGAFGVHKLASDEPRLHELVSDVARQVDTEAVDEIYIGPGSEIGVHQEGRGPFGIFGVKRRVLTLGLASLQFLTVSELRAIMAHEYAHFSHGDTFFSRFIHQVSLTIDASLRAMAEAGGKLNYVNPFYWFLVLYYRAYNMMSSGFSRSREFLADRMAASLYGANVFSTALCKVVMHGTYYDVQLNQYLASKFAGHDTGQPNQPPVDFLPASVTNLYEASRKREHDSRNDPERLVEIKEMLNEKGSLFSSHPTVGERLEAIAGFSSDHDTDTTPARALLVNPDSIERELTEFVQSYAEYIGGIAAAAQAARQNLVPQKSCATR